MEYQIMFYGGLAGAIISLIVSIIVFIKLNIKEVLEDFLGFRFAKLFSRGNKQRDAAERPITNEIVLRKQDAVEDTALMGAGTGTASTALMTAGAEVASTALLTDETELLSEADDTALLSETGILTDETTLLSETTLLTESQDFYFKKELDIVVVHSQNVIQ
jgi:hypothetical protein